MPTQQDYDKIKENIQDLRVFLKSIHTEGLTVISSVFASLGKTDDTDLGLQTTLNLYSNALVTTNNIVSIYLAASITGYKNLIPENLSKSFTNVADCFNKTFLQADDYLKIIEANPALYWHNTCTGTIYFPNSSAILSVVLAKLVSTNFIKSTDADYTDKVNQALAALEASLRKSLQ